MPTGTIDSAIFKDIFGTEAMRQVWSDGNRIQKYLDFEAGLARAQAKLNSGELVTARFARVSALLSDASPRARDCS